MAQRLDNIDYRMIELLSQDGRLSSAEIARAIGNISERSVRYRLEKLIADGTLRVCAILNPCALGFNVKAEVVIEVEPGQVVEVANQVAKYEQVTYVACLSGGTEISIQVVARDNSELFNFVTDVVGKIPGVTRLTTSIVPHVVKEPASWQLPTGLHNGDQ